MKKMNAMAGLTAGVVLALGACTGAQELEPAPEATRTEGPGTAVVARDAGVRVEAQVDAWDGNPDELEGVMTPIRVEVRNRSDEPLRLRYQEFQLVEPDGTRRAAIPPFDINDDVATSARVRPAYAYDGFYIAPHLQTFYDFDAYEPFDHEPYYYDDFYPYYASVTKLELPSPSMLEKALPEGVVAPGGHAEGFLYFQDVDPDAPRVNFEVDLTHAMTGADFGRVEIPFEVGAQDR
jgi:hypothetical protein